MDRTAREDGPGAVQQVQDVDSPATMKTSRILIFEERPSPGRELRLNLLDHAVEFDFRDPAKENLETLDLSRYAAIVAPAEPAQVGLIGILSAAKRYAGTLFLYRDEPPVHEVARWV